MSYEPFVNDALVDREDATWGDEVRYHTPYHDFVYPGRRTLLLKDRTWPHTPEECPGHPEFENKWFIEDTVLVCMGCGLDGT